MTERIAGECGCLNAMDDATTRDTASADDERDDAAARRLVDLVAERERREAENQIARERAMVDAARRRAGEGGAILAAMMIGLQKVYDPGYKEPAVEVQQSPTEPEDLDADGIMLSAEFVGGANDVGVPPLPLRSPYAPKPSRRSRRRR